MNAAETDSLEFDSAQEFVKDRLKQGDGPFSPSDLADEYGCSNGHMRHVLKELVDQGDALRVSHGQYMPIRQREEQSPTDWEPYPVNRHHTTAGYLLGASGGIAALNILHIVTDPGVVVPAMVALLVAVLGLYVQFGQPGGEA